MMVEKKRKVPNLRFEGFTNDWVQRNLGEVVQKVKSYSLSRDVETEDDTGFEYIHYGDIHTQKADVIDGNTKLPSIVPGDYDLVQVGDVIVADASEDYLGIAEPAVVVNKPTQNLVAGLHTIAIRPNGIHPLFLYYLLHTQLFKHFGYRTGTGLKVFSISYPNLAKFTFAMPTLDEQEAIANTLRDMDNLIAANQRKLDLLKEQKKGYLQKMFPKNGAKVPELRFAGFADDWEERKFGELYKKVNEKNDLSFGKDRVISVANMYFKDTDNIRSDDAYMKTYNIFRTGDIAFEGNRSKHFSYGRFVENTIGDGIVSHVFDVFRPIQQFDLNYWKYAIHNERVMGPILMTATTSSTMMTNLVAKDFLKRAILVPSYSEQKLVGSFFKQLDDTIVLQHQKLAKYQSVKKSLLQQMFI